MQAENRHSRQKRQRLWYQRDGFLWGLVAALIAAAWGLLPPAGTSLGIGGWLGMGLYMLLAAVPMIVTTMDKRRPQLAGTAAALGFLGLLELIVETWPILLGGLENTLLIFICSAVLSVTIAPIIAIIRTLNNPIFNCAIDAFVDVFRSLPILVLVIFIYYALPFLEIHSTPFAAGVCGLFLSALAFMIEYFRAGIESVSRGHVEAARSLGLGVIQTMRFVILPLAIRVVLPPLTGHLVGLLKATAFVSVVGMPELLKRAMEIVEWKANPTPLVTITIMYLILLLPLMYGSTLLERRLARWTTPHRA